MRFLPALPISFLLLVHLPAVHAQYVRPLPYSSQLKTDPAVGNVQGIQRYGRPLKTDPDQGVGFSYHVYPVADGTNVAVNQGANTGGSGGGGGVTVRSTNLRGVLQAQLFGSKDQEKGIAELDSEVKRRQILLNEGLVPREEFEAFRKNLEGLKSDLDTEKARAFDELSKAALQSTGGGEGGVTQSAVVPGYGAGYEAFVPGAAPSYPYSSRFDWTEGLRNFAVPTVPTTPFVDPAANAFGVERAISVNRAGLTYTTPQIYHQPLIQIKMRIVEVARTDGLQVASALEYVSSDGRASSRTSGRTTNDGKQNFRGVTTFDLPGIITSAGSGTGALINLTTKHINWLLQALSVEMNADVITAPEVVTLNGQNVEFVSGDKLPFQLGQNVVQGTNNNIQQVFYKHVGTMVSVTPRIVNWGLHGEGQGEAAIVANDVLNWKALLEQMHNLVHNSKIRFQVKRTESDGNGGTVEKTVNIAGTLGKYRHYEYVPYSVQSVVLEALNDYSRRDMRLLLKLCELEVIDDQACDRCNRWKPENCTIDLSVVVRLSEGGEVALDDEGKTDLTKATTNEKNVRAVANVIQVKSGHGVVMAGLIGERENDELRKTPVLGDLPVVGFAFRSKIVNRVKTEVLVFIEATVLDQDPCVARAESAHNFLLGQPYVEGEFLDNPLEVGMYRVGFGSYLPPHTHGERIFWERFGRKVRKIHTHLDDTFLK